MRYGTFSAAAIALLALSACGRSTRQYDTAIDPNTPAAVQITNNNHQDVDVFLDRGGDRLRLGMVTTGQTQTFNVPGRTVQGRNDLRIVIHPIGGGGDYNTETLIIEPGETVDLQVAQAINQSRLLKTAADPS